MYTHFIYTKLKTPTNAHGEGHKSKGRNVSFVRANERRRDVYLSNRRRKIQFDFGAERTLCCGSDYYIFDGKKGIKFTDAHRTGTTTMKTQRVLKQ